MRKSESINYKRIAEAIAYIKTHFKDQPDLDKVAEKIHLSPFHFQRLFTEWAGVSPKKFVQYLTVQYAKSILKAKELSLFDAAHESGLSGTSRLHDLFISIEGMTPGEFKNEGENLNINYSFSETLFGNVLVASTPKGLCHLMFFEDKEFALKELQSSFPKANYKEIADSIQKNALDIFSPDQNNLAEIKLHLKGTPFQLKVWNALLKIPSGQLSTYGNIAKNIEQETASRAVGTAIGSNPIAFIIPCHRVIQATGTYGQYRWGSPRKSVLIGWEAAQKAK